MNIIAHCLICCKARRLRETRWAGVILGALMQSLLFTTTKDCRAAEWKTLEGHKKPIICAAISVDNSMIASGDAEGLIRLWDVAKGKEMATLKDGFAIVNRLFFLDDGATLLSVSRQDGKKSDFSSKLLWWDLKTKKALRQVVVPFPFGDIVVSAKGKVLATGTGKPFDSTICIRNAYTGEVVQTLSWLGEIVGRLALSADGKLLAAERKGLIKIWSLETGKVLAFYKVGGAYGLSFRPDSKRVSSITYDGFITFFDFEKNEVTKEVKGPAGNNYSYLAYTPDGKQLVTACGGLVSFLDHETGKVRKNIWVGFQVTSIALSQDGNILLTGGTDDLTIKTWKLPLEK